MRKIFFALLAALVWTGVMTAATYDFDVLVSCPQLTKGASYTLVVGSTSSTVTAR